MNISKEEYLIAKQLIANYEKQEFDIVVKNSHIKYLQLDRGLRNQIGFVYHKVSKMEAIKELMDAAGITLTESKEICEREYGSTMIV